jgi:hypothetical protein
MRALLTSWLLAAASIACTASALAQYSIGTESGDTVRFESEALRAMLDTARALYADLQEDPRVGYITPAANPAGRQPVREQNPLAAYPWNAITVLDDSTVDVMNLPANLREADRAYYNYAVKRMRVVRGADPDVPCDSLLALEEQVVDSFIDGWILSRTLYGGPPFAPLDELAFARRDGLLRPLLASARDPQVGACAAEWADHNPGRMQAYETWRKERHPTAAEGEGDAGEPADSTALPPADSVASPQADSTASAPGSETSRDP